MMHRMGDRVSYYRDATMTGVVAEVEPIDTLRVAYGVRWDDTPDRLAHWYTYSMLTPLKPYEAVREKYRENQ